MRLTEYPFSGLCFVVLLALPVIGKADTLADPELVTPGATILAYCNSKIFDENSKFFNLEHSKTANSGPVRLAWKNCRVIKETSTTLEGQKIETNRIATSGDIEVTLEIDAMDKKEKTIRQQYWFLLRHYPIGWQIISYSLVGE